jgi:hypothetical protein
MLFRFASSLGLAAAVSMAAAPLTAAELPAVPASAGVSHSVIDPGAINAQNHRRWYRRDRVDAGDVIGGLLVLGTIAAVASAATKASRDRQYRYPQRYPAPDQRYDYRGATDGPAWSGRGGIDRAVDMCTREVERNARVDTVDNAERGASGWHVDGRLRRGASFNCRIGNDGRIEGIDYGQGLDRRGAIDDTQWDDDRYAAARHSQDAGDAPAYPGGPVPDDDGRYDSAESPDFPG